jgi:hypothetical protein
MSRTKTITVTVGSLAAGAILATGITGIASASGTTSTHNTPTATQSSKAPGSAHSTTPGGHVDGQRGGRRGGPHGGDQGMPGGPRGDALHAEAVVKAADGTISTVRMIHGAVTAVSSSSISVKAEDGFTATYDVTSTTAVHTGLPSRGHGPGDAAGSTAGSSTAPAATTIADVKVGDVAMVEGTVTGSTVMATEIRSMTAAQAAQVDQLRAQHDPQQSGATSSSSAAPPSAA